MRLTIKILYDMLSGGHDFSETEAPETFRFRLLYGFLVIVFIAASFFALAGFSGLNPIGQVQSIADALYGFSALVMLIVLRRCRKCYTVVTHLLLFFSMLTCISILVSVPQDESRLVWFYLVVVVAFILGGLRSGVIYTLLSAAVILIAHQTIDLNLSIVAYFSGTTGLLILSVLMYTYRQRVDAYEATLTRQNRELETFNSGLEQQIAAKTAELIELNASLERKISEKIVEVKQQEEMLIAQSRLAAMGEMLSMIAHQWRQPLSTMSLMIADAQLKAAIGGKEIDANAILTEISDTIGYLSETIDDFKTYFEPQRRLETVSLRTLLDRVIQFTHHRYKMNRISLTVNADKSLEIETYPSELIQIFMNLLNNAADAIIENGPADPYVEITITDSDDWLEIEMLDNGGGIGETYLSRIFEPYFSTKSKNGTGLGLYMTKMILENHMGGTIEASNQGPGARFLVRIPLSLKRAGVAKTAIR